jgi:transglutaminase-like putative cysteine protease
LIGCDATAPQAPPALPIGIPTLEATTTWELLFMQGNRVGHAKTTFKPAEVAGQDCWQINSETVLNLKRFGQDHTQSIELESLETATGKLLRANVRSALGPTPVETRITPSADGLQLSLVTTAGEQNTTTQLPWQPNGGGFFAIELALRGLPLQPGATRSLTCLMPLVNQVASVEMTAGDWQDTTWFDGTQKRLLAVNTVAKLTDGNTFRTTYWLNEQGEPLKSRTDALDQETYRTDQATALQQTETFDLAVSSSVPVEMPTPNPHASQQIVYRVLLKDGNPRDVFVNSWRQQITDTVPHEAKLFVRANREVADDSTMPELVDSENDQQPTDDDRNPNTLVQSDDANVVALANEVAADIAPLDLAKQLTQLVHQRVAKKNFSQAFASAADVAATLEGDCTEHAVLLAALLRARKIPARVAIGLVYVPGMQAFGYHMWTEAYLTMDGQKGKWLPFDATLETGHVGPAHLHLASSNLAGASAYSAFLPVAQVLGRLTIEVLEVR